MNRKKEALVSTDPSAAKELDLSAARDPLRVVRQAIVAEMDAANLYQQVADSLPPAYKEVADIFNHVAEEELVHVGEFMKALELLEPSELEAYEKGKKEAEEH